MSTTSTLSAGTGAPQILSAAGLSQPVGLIYFPGRDPTYYVAPSPDANFDGFLEITFDQPDATGALPAAGNWLPLFYKDSGTPVTFNFNTLNGAVPRGFYYPLAITATAIRAHVVDYTSGTLTFGVAQPPVQRQ